MTVLAYSGKYIPRNPNKYIGDPNKVLYRSLWERQVCKYLDLNSGVLEWGYEITIIPYFSEVEQKVRRYFVDFFAKIRTKDGTVTYLMEVKPKKQCKKPKKRNTRRYLIEAQTYTRNLNKWDAAMKFAKKRGWKFIIITEDNLVVSRRPK